MASRVVFTSRSYAALVRSYGLRQEFITPYCPEQNGTVERVNDPVIPRWGQIRLKVASSEVFV